MVAFSRIAYFGDSLTDQSFIWDASLDLLTMPVPPAYLGYDQRFTNGEVYAQITPDLLGISDYDNYAVAGARARGSRTLEDLFETNGVDSLIIDDTDPGLQVDINLGAQVDRFFDENTGDLSDTAAQLFVGINDYQTFNPTGTILDPFLAYRFADRVTDSIIGAGIELARAGVGTIILNTLPQASFFPLAQGLSSGALDDADDLVALHNEFLRDEASWIAAEGAEVIFVDTAYLAAEVLEDADSFGFIAPLFDTAVDGTGLTAVLDVALLDAYDADQILFWDEVHFSAAMHGVLGAFTAATLTSRVRLLGDDHDVINGYGRDDLILTSGGRDTVNTRGGNDIVLGGTARDVIELGRGYDIAGGGDNNDIIYGGRGFDVLAGNARNDLLYGGRGRDVLIDGLGDDEAYGEDGADTFIYVSPDLVGGSIGPDTDLFDGGNGSDTAYIVLNEDMFDAVTGGGMTEAEALATLGLTLTSVETVVFLDGRGELSSIDALARLDEADLWGLI